MCLKHTIIKYSNYIIQRWYLNFSHIYKQAIHSIREYIGPLNKVGLMCNECTCIICWTVLIGYLVKVGPLVQLVGVGLEVMVG